MTAHLDGCVERCGGMAPSPGHDGGQGEPKRIFVARAVRRRRLAAETVGRPEDEARARGVTAMRLETGEARPGTIRACEGLGYRRRGPFGSHVENGSPVLVEKAL